MCVNYESSQVRHEFSTIYLKYLLLLHVHRKVSGASKKIKTAFYFLISISDQRKDVQAKGNEFQRRFQNANLVFFYPNEATLAFFTPESMCREPSRSTASF